MKKIRFDRIGFIIWAAISFFKVLDTATLIEYNINYNEVHIDWKEFTILMIALIFLNISYEKK